jgi:hypothetical protein
MGSKEIRSQGLTDLAQRGRKDWISSKLHTMKEELVSLRTTLLGDLTMRESTLILSLSVIVALYVTVNLCSTNKIT